LTAVPETLVPDTSVLIDGRITELLTQGDFPNAHVAIPQAAFAELEAQANRGAETGISGLDELAALQRMAQEGKISVELVGRRPGSDEIERAKTGAIDALIRDTAVELGGLYVTSDRVSAHAAAAQGIRHHYIRPIVHNVDLTTLALWSFFDEHTMSVHLKADCVPMVKRGQPGAVVYEPHKPTSREMKHQDLRNMVRECIEFAKRDYNSFIEMEKKGCTVIQLGPMRITIASPPFSDGLEVTAVRPVRKLTIDEYDLPEEILSRLEGKARGCFVAGPPGSGKSTFAAAVAEHLHGLHRVVKTMEQPRDLQVPKEVTQYGALDRDMKWTGEVTLLVRPDHVIYDEVRTTDDFVTFADMRLAGVGMIGVTHANRAIDAVQRLIGRVDLGMIPQVIDTVLFVDAGKIATVLELTFTVKVPVGMTDADLARPVVEVKDVMTGRAVYEMYTYGEQVVVMPLETAQSNDPGDRLMGREVERLLRKYVSGPMDIQVRGRKAIVSVDETEVAQLIGKGGKTVQSLERKLGLHLSINALKGPPPRRDRDDDRHQGGWDGSRDGSNGGREREHRGGAQNVPRVRVKRTSTNVFLLVEGARAGPYRIECEGAVIGEAVASKEGRLRFKADSPEGQAIVAAEKSGLDLTVIEA
jgi:ATPase